VRFEYLFAALVAASLPQLAQAQESAPASAPASGVVSYPAEFFASGQPNTAMEMIYRMPGFTFEAGDAVRGFSGAGGNVLIDGERPATKSDDLESVLRRVPASQVERIDVIRGGAPGIDMQGKTVLANVVRKKGDSVTGLISVVNAFVYDGRNTPGVRLEATRSGGGKKLEGSLVIAGFYDDGAGNGPRVYTDGPAPGDDSGRWDVYTEGDGMQAVATGAYELPMLGGKVRVNGRAFQQIFWYDEVAYGVGSTPDGLTERDHERRREGEGGLNYTRDLGPRTKLDTLFLQSLKKYDLFVKLQDYSAPDPDDDLDAALVIDRMTGESIGRTTVKFQHSAALSLESGAEGAFNWLDSDASFTSAGGIPDPANTKVEELRGEVFGQGTWTPSPKLTLEGGLRFEASKISSEADAGAGTPAVSKEKTLTFLKPRAVATWSPNENNQFRARFQREVDQLNFDDFVAAVEAGVVLSGNPDLNPEHAWVSEAAYERRFWKSGSITFTIRHFAISDVIDRAPIEVAPGQFNDAPANIGEGTRDEFGLALTLPVDRIGLKGGMLRAESTWRRSEVTDPTTGEMREISGEHPVDWEVRYTQGLPQWNMTWGFDVFGSLREPFYRYNEVTQIKLRSFVQPWIEWKPRRDISIRADVQNATSRNFNRTREVYDGPRDTVPMLYREHQELDNKPSLYVRVRKTFG
jgi:outer membrane receptor protein involved in Fe transport